MKKSILLILAGLLSVTPFVSGQIVFSQEYGGLYDEDGRWMEQMPDSGFIMTGGTETYSSGQSDIWLVRTDLNGVVQWTRSYGGPLFDFANMVKPTTDGGFVIAGFTGSYGSGDNDGWIIKTNSTGSIQWQKIMGDGGIQEIEAIVQTSDGGYAAVGINYGTGSLYYDMWVVRLDANGDSLWTKNVGGGSFEIGNSIQQTADGGFVIAGQSYSYGAENGDYILYKLDANGNVQWYRNYDMPGLQECHYVQPTTDGGYVLVGDADSIPNNLGQTDIWVIKTNATGDTLWTKPLGGSKKDGGKTVEQTSDGGYIVCGITRSYTLINPNYYLGKLDSLGTIEWENYSYGSAYHDHAYRAIQTSDGGYANFGYFRNATTSQNFALVKLGPDGGVSKDVAIDNIIDPEATLCRTSGVNIEMIITNYGATNEQNIPVTLIIDNGTTQTTLRDTLFGSLNPSLSRILTFQQAYDFNQSGTYTLHAYISHLINDASLSNDTSDLVVTVLDPVVDPSTVSGVKCTSGSVTLNAVPSSPSDSLFWYDAPTGGTLINWGTGYTTPSLSATTDYYVESLRGKGYLTGEPDNTIGGGGITTNGVLEFDTRVSFKLISVRVYAATAGVRIIELRDASNNVLQSKTVTLPIGWSRVYLNFDVPTAVDLKLGLGAGSVGLFRNSNGANYPYSVSRVLEIFGSNGGAGSYYYFYDWNIFVPYQQCESGRTKVTAQIGTAATTAFDRSRCNTGPVTLTANSTDALSWYAIPSGGAPLASGTSFTTASISSTTTYYLQVGSCSGRIPVQAIVNNTSASPSVTPSNNCGPGTVTLGASSPDPITWYDAPTNGNIVGTGTTYTTPYLNSSTTYYAVAGTSCPSAAVPVLATINAATAPTGTGAQACGPASVTISASSTDPIEWYAVPAGGTPIATGSTLTTPILANTTTYYAQAINTCPSARTAVTATIITVQAPAGTGAARCGSGVAVISASSVNNVTWWDAASGGAQIGSGPVYTTPVLTQTTTFYAQANDGSCISARTPVSATVNITTPPAATDVARCGAGSVVLSATAVDSIYWYDAPSGGNLLGSGSSFTTPSITSTTTYWAEANNGCASARVAVQAIIASQAAAPLVTDSSRCGSGSVTLTASSPDPVSWYDMASGGTLLGMGLTFNTPSLSASATFYAIAGVPGCESTPVACTATVNPLAAAPVVTNDQNCGPDTLTLLASSVNPLTWYDAPTGGVIVTTGTSYQSYFTTTTTYYVEGFDGTCPSNRIAVTASVFAPPAVNLGPDTLNIATGQVVTLDAGAGFSSYLWSTGATTQSINASATGTYSVVVTDINGCTGSDQTVINVITGISELLSSGDLQMYPNPTSGIITIELKNKKLTNGELRIIDLLGQCVYFTTDLPRQRLTIDLSALSQGLYYVRITSSEGTLSKPVLIE